MTDQALTPLEDTTRNQRRAADPARSVIVMANAGSGKTRVLTNRVARLLLAGAPPEKILCITFTKAAAAEMAERLFSVLGEWALASDEELVEALADLEGDDAPAKTAEDLALARRLFAKALETPGGLKIQTIHSFCESVLRRFPIEAGAPPGFSVVEDAQAAALLGAALDDLALAARDDAEIGAAFDRLAASRKEETLRALLLSAAGGATLEQGLNDAGGVEGALSALARALLIDPQASEDDVKGAFLGALSEADIKRAHDGLAAEGKAPQDAAKRLAPFFTATAVADKWAALEALLLTADGSVRKKIATKATDKHDRWVGQFLDGLKEQFAAAVERLKSLALFQDTAALLRLAAALRARYGAAKAARAALDFDDLILRAQDLFAQTQSAWIMYKLDYGVDHILIDEAQDTSPGQWQVVESLFAEYFSGAGARQAERSFFAVGDLKQSIYSFQGADAELFKVKEVDLGERLAIVSDYENVPLTLSFRTTAPVLSFVDAAFNDPAAADGLGEFPIPVHGVCRAGAAGLVERWPLAPRREPDMLNPWDAPVDAPEAAHPVRVLCDRIAATIKGWLVNGEVLESRGTPVTPGDIMILVQSRGPLFRDIIQRLAAAGVPVAGPDRLKLAEDPAVEDLLSYARFALSTRDDLSLAEILKSPLFGFDDDRDLFPLAHFRAPGENLWRALQARANEQPHWRRAVDEITAARAIARKEGPFAFFNHVLESGGHSVGDSGRRRFYARLGMASSDAMDEILRQAIDFENGGLRSLREFVAWFEAAAGDIKREMARETHAVRVMTVHGAKGLEAEVVFLLDAHRDVNLKNIGPLIEPAREAGLPRGLKLLAGAKAGDVALSAAARAEKTAKAFAEYRRLFYVAATRARDRLYICGVEQGNKGDPETKEIGLKSWHALAGDAFERLGDKMELGEAPFWDGAPAVLQRLRSSQEAAIENPDTEDVDAPPPARPSWLFEKARSEAPTAQLTPSKLAGEEDMGEGQLAGDQRAGNQRADRDADEFAPNDSAYSPIAGAPGGDRYFRGRVLHRLLELLPDAPPAARVGAADRLLARLAPDIDADERARWGEEVLRVLGDPQFAAVFAPGSRAETPIVGRPQGAPLRLRINGQIDRLAVSEKQVLVVDYKTNRPPPTDATRADRAYVAQMAAYRALLQEIYPGRQIVCALLWTYDARLMVLPDEMLDHAFALIAKAG